jgi:hypothetical protein
MAIHDNLPFGKQVVFTYGPLGFLTYPFFWYSGLGTAAFAYNLVIRFLLALTVFAGARRTFGDLASFLLAVVAAGFGVALIEPVVFLIAAVLLLAWAPRGWRSDLVAAGAGAACGFELLDKFSTGITLTVMTAVLIAGLPRRRLQALGIAAGSLVASFLIFWLATGQGLGSIGDYLKNAEQIVSGYAAAMELAAAGLGWQAAAALIGLAIGVWAALHSTAGSPRRLRLATAGLWVAFWYLLFKEGFVRHDSGHAAVFFSALAAGIFAFAWRPGYRLTGLACIAALVGFALAAQGVSFGTVIDPTADVSNAISEIGDVVSSSDRQQLVADGRASIRASYPLDRTALGLLAGRTTAVYPAEIAQAWAYDLKWDPLPVLQSYSAYTADLDRLDADFLRSAKAPQRILLRDDPAIDGRILSFDEPLTARTMLCRYGLAHSAPPDAILVRDTNRCSAPALLSVVHARWGQWVPVPPPAPGSLVFARVGGVAPSGLESIRALFFKPVERSVFINFGPKSRLVPATASDGLPLRAARGVDYPSPFNIAVGASSIAVLKGSYAGSGSHSITFAFYEQPISRSS